MRGLLTMVFDDGYEAVYQHVVPLLNSAHLPGVFALPLDTATFQKTVTEPVREWSQWLHVKEQGHELAAHSVSHSDLRLLTNDQLEDELSKPQAALRATTLIYPGGAVNDDVEQAAQKYYTAARTTAYGFEKIPPPNPWRLKTVDYTKSNYSVGKANTRVLWAALTNSWLIETYHLVDPAIGGVDKKTSNMHHSVLLTDFTRHIKFIQKLAIPVKTINEVIRDSHN